MTTRVKVYSALIVAEVIVFAMLFQGFWDVYYSFMPITW